MSAQLTTAQIAAQLERAESAADLATLLRAIAARRLQVKTELVAIDSRDGTARLAAIASGEPRKVAEVNRLAETLVAEQEVLDALDARASQKHAAAQERETVETARRNHKNLSRLADAASRAYAAYASAREELNDALTTITVARVQLDAGERDAITVSDEVFERVKAAMFAGWPADSSQVPAAALRGRICAPSNATIKSSFYF